MEGFSVQAAASEIERVPMSPIKDPMALCKDPVKLYEEGENFFSPPDQKSYDFEQAAACYYEAALYGHKDAQYDRGVCLEFGIGVEQDKVAAYALYEFAAAQGHRAAQGALIFREMRLKAREDGSASATDLSGNLKAAMPEVDQEDVSQDALLDVQKLLDPKLDEALMTVPALRVDIQLPKTLRNTSFADKLTWWEKEFGASTAMSLIVHQFETAYQKPLEDFSNEELDRIFTYQDPELSSNQINVTIKGHIDQLDKLDFIQDHLFVKITQTEKRNNEEDIDNTNPFLGSLKDIYDQNNTKIDKIKKNKKDLKNDTQFLNCLYFKAKALENGSGVEKNLEQAAYIYMLLALRNNENAQDALLRLPEQNREKIIEKLKSFSQYEESSFQRRSSELSKELEESLNPSTPCVQQAQRRDLDVLRFLSSCRKLKIEKAPGRTPSSIARRLFSDDLLQVQDANFK